MENGNSGNGRLGQRAGAILDKAESVYLRILRAAILILATLLIIYAVGLAAISLYKVSQSPASVKEKVASVAPQELTAAELPARPTAAQRSGPVVNPAQKAAYDRFLTAYYRLFKANFEPYRQREDKQLSLDEFNDSYVNTGQRLSSIGRKELDFKQDHADLQSLLVVMNQASNLPETLQRLKKYQTAKKIQVCENVQRIRSESRISWDPNSYACTDWYESGGCYVTREVEVPYTEKSCKMQFPEGTQPHTQVFRAYQNQYYSLLNGRREANALAAQAERNAILRNISEGEDSLSTALKIAAGFVLLMFFFLLIAIERHQRRIAAEQADRT